MATSLNIIIVEDHDSLRIVTATMLRQHGHTVTELACAEDLDDEAGNQFADIFILDLNLPDEDGISLARRIRKVNPTVGIIMVTARNQLDDRIIGYQSGADIYLIKPVNPIELLATISSLSRRLQTVSSSVNQLTLDLKQLSLQNEALNKITVNRSEAIMLQTLARAKNQQLEYWQLIEAIGQSSNHAFKKSNLEVKIHRLRHKIMQLCSDDEVIKSIREYGYKLCVDLVIL
jgi:DNA-binding response OmpR family regulator